MILLALLALLSPVAPQEPDGPWRQVVDPAAAGWSAERLDAVRARATAAGSAAVLVIDRGRVVVAWGAVDAPFRMASMRKALYTLVCGVHHDRGSFDPEAAIGDLGIDDIHGLTDEEKSARVIDLMAARSGIYHPAAYETDGNAAARPSRGSAGPDERWYYNNWDFNVVPVAFERMTGVPLARAFEQDLARPLGLEDFVPARDVFAYLEPSLSLHPALVFRLSARDLARLGLLVLHGGSWNGREIVSRSWLDLATTPRTTFEPGDPRGAGNGFGLMWFVLPARADDARELERHVRWMTQGAGGHAMVLVPDLDLVLVHRTDTDRGRGMDDMDVLELFASLVDARTGGGEQDPELGPLAPLPLGPFEPLVPPRGEPVPEELRRALLGAWSVGPDRLELFEHDGRLFARRVGKRVQESELQVDAGGRLFAPEAPLVLEVVERDGAAATALSATLFGRTARAVRVP